MTEESKNLRTQLNDSADNILRAVTRSVPFLKFREGQYLVGEDEIPVGREFFAFVLEWVQGWVKWSDGAIVADKLGKVADGFKPSQREDLDDNDPTKWENDQDPWQQQNMLPMEDVETGDLLIFVTTTQSGRFAIEQLAARVARDIKSGRDRGRPIISLQVGKGTSKKYGKTYPKPHFQIERWERDETPPPPAKDEFGDQIPY
jgi:hypothetical protein